MKKLSITVLLVLALLGGVLASFYRPDVPVEELLPRYADEASRFADVDGVKVHYKDEGEGPVLVLLHGFASSLHTWDGWARELRSDFRVVRFDQPGHGLTGPRPDGDYRTEAYADFLGHFLDRLGIERCSLAGNSMGGGVAWLFAAREGERVEKLVLVDAAGAPPPGDGVASGGGSTVLSFIQAPVVRRLVPRFSPRFLFARALHEVYADDTLVTDELVDRYYALARRAGNRDALMGRLRGRGADHPELLQELRQPTLVMWGAEDLWIPVANAERFHAAVPRSEVLVYPDVGHLPQEEAPERTADDARAFLLSDAS